MARNGIDRMTHSELLLLRNKIDQLIAKRKSEERAEAKAKILELARTSGFELKDLVAPGRGARRGVKIAPKYVNPANPAQTWTGRGRTPTWMRAATRRGGRREDFLIRS